MYTAKVKFDNVVDAQKFVGICNDMNFKVELLSGAYVIDAKSIMGIFSLDLSQPLRLDIHDDAQADSCLKLLSPYLVDQDHT